MAKQQHNMQKRPDGFMSELDYLRSENEMLKHVIQAAKHSGQLTIGIDENLPANVGIAVPAGNLLKAQRETDLVRAYWDLADLGRDVLAMYEQLQVALVLVGAGDTLAAFVRTNDYQGRLLKVAQTFVRTVEAQRAHGVYALADHETGALVRAFEALAWHCQQASEGETGPLVEALTNPQIEHFLSMLRQQLDKGGRPRDERLDALYRLAWPILKAQARRCWQDAERALWHAIEQTAPDQRSSDQRAVFELWQGLSYNQRKEQLKALLKGAG